MTKLCPPARVPESWRRMSRPAARGLAAVLAALHLFGSAEAWGQAPSESLTRFAGTWVGTQSWAIENPPPGARQDQPVILTIDVVDGKVTGSMTPFLGGDEGATFVDTRMVGDALHATAVVGTPRQEGRRRGAPSWKESVAIAFVFRSAGVGMTGTAEVKMGDVPWMTLTYQLGKKRSRY